MNENQNKELFKIWTLSDIREVLEKVSKETGVSIDDVKVSISSKKMTRVLGYCKFKRTSEGIKTLELKFSYWLVNGYYSEEDVLDTILHEFTHHYCNVKYNVDCGHNYRWKQACLLIGANPNRFAEIKQCNQEVLKKDMGNLNVPKYTIICEYCGNISHRRRMTYTLEQFKKIYRCGRCGGTLDVKTR